MNLHNIPFRNYEDSWALASLDERYTDADGNRLPDGVVVINPKPKQRTVTATGVSESVSRRAITYHDAIKVGNLWLRRGQEVSIKGERGRFRFQSMVTTRRGTSWLNVTDHRGGTRSFDVEQIKTIHRVKVA